MRSGSYISSISSPIFRKVEVYAVYAPVFDWIQNIFFKRSDWGCKIIATFIHFPETDFTNLNNNDEVTRNDCCKNVLISKKVLPWRSRKIYIVVFVIELGKKWVAHCDNMFTAFYWKVTEFRVFLFCQTHAYVSRACKKRASWSVCRKI